MLFSVIPKLTSLTTNTVYRSPIKLLSLTAEESKSFSTNVLTKAKERAVNNRGVSEEEWNALLQNTNSTTWAFHRLVYELEALLHFLEDGLFDADGMSKAAYLSFNPAFVQFISSSFAPAFQKAARDALRKEDDYETAQRLMPFVSFVLPAHHEIAFATVKDHLQHLAKTLELLHWEGFTRNETVLYFVFSPHWTQFINGLPAACDEERADVVKALLQVLKRFRLDASPDYLKAVCTKLHGLKMELAQRQELQEYGASFRTQRMLNEPKKKARNNNWIYFAGGGVVLAAILVMLKLAGRNKTVPDPVFDTVGSTQTSPISDQLNSSVNERNLKGFFYLSSKQKNTGEKENIRTGTTPLPGITKLPSGKGNSNLTIRNETSADALLFYFGTDNPLVGVQSRLVAVYIRSGEAYSFQFQPDFGRFNFLFGKNWVHLTNPVPFPVYTGEGLALPVAEKDQLKNAWAVSDFFERVLPSQPFLNHDLVITNIQQQTDSSANMPIVYTLLNEKERDKRYYEAGTAAITLQEKEGRIIATAKSSLYVYRSPKTFDPNELR